jgi:hypothetical protein
MKKLFILFMGMLLMGSCISQKQLKKDVPPVEEVQPPFFIEGYTPAQIDSFYHGRTDLAFRSYFLTNDYLIRVDTLKEVIKSLNLQLSVLRNYVNTTVPTLAKRAKIVYSHDGENGYTTDMNIFLDFSKDEQIPSVLQFFILFNAGKAYSAVGTFNVDLNNLHDVYYGVTCPEGDTGYSPADFKASYTIVYDKQTKKVNIQRKRMGRNSVGTWYRSLNDTNYGIRSIVAIY